MNDTNAEPLDEPTRALVVFTAAIAQGEVSAMRESAEEAVAAGVRATWGDELLLQPSCTCSQSSFTLFQSS